MAVLSETPRSATHSEPGASSPEGERPRALLVNPPFLPRYSRSQRSPGVIRSGTLYYPIWLASATGVLEAAGYECRLLDCPADGTSEADVLDLMRQWTPDVVVCDTSTPSAESDLEFVEHLQRSFPEVWVAAVGTHVTATWRESFEQHPDMRFALLGEYDDTVLAFAQCRLANGDPAAVPGVAFRKNGAAVKTAERAPIEDMDSLPFVSQVYARHLDIRNYRYSITRHPVVTIVTGRGCPFRCIYCLYPQVMHGHTYRSRSVESVVEEFSRIRTELPEVREVFIEDDTFTVDKPRLRALCEALVRDGNRLKWTANARADVRREDLVLMRRAGCRLLCVGFESGSNELLKSMEKAMALERAWRFRGDARRARVMVHGCFMVGNPGETAESMLDTLDYAKALACDTAQFFPIMVYPGTAAFDWAKERGYLRAENYREWLNETGQHRCVVDTDTLTAEAMMQFCDEARRSYYLRPAYFWQQARTILRSPREAPRILKAFASLSRYLFKRSGTIR